MLRPGQRDWGSGRGLRPGLLSPIALPLSWSPRLSNRAYLTACKGRGSSGSGLESVLTKAGYACVGAARLPCSPGGEVLHPSPVRRRLHRRTEGVAELLSAALSAPLISGGLVLPAPLLSPQSPQEALGFLLRRAAWVKHLPFQAREALISVNCLSSAELSPVCVKAEESAATSQTRLAENPASLPARMPTGPSTQMGLSTPCFP